MPWGILIGGEELHNNHHAYGSSAKLSSRWYEFDIGWLYISILAFLGLARVHKVAPRLRVMPTVKHVPDLATLHAVITHRYTVAARYAKELRAACAAEIAQLRERGAELAHVPDMSRLRRWLAADSTSALPERERATLAQLVERSQRAAYDLRHAPGAQRPLGALDRIQRAAACCACRTGAIAPNPRAFRRWRAFRWSSSATRKSRLR